MRAESDRPILLASADPATLRALECGLEREGYIVLKATNLHEATRALEHAPRAAIAEATLPGGSGLKLLGATDAPVLLLAEFASVTQAVAAVKAGAWDYLPRPLDLAALKTSLKAALAKPKTKAALEAKDAGFRDEGFIAESPGMRAVRDLVARVAPSRATVMVFGESGVGKEVVARAVHRASARAGGPFSPISCAAIPETLLESELFGYEKGAFTGANGAKAGRFEAAGGGTLFLDEVGEIPLTVQAKLLRVMQEREVERLGSLARTPIDVRVVTATHRDLDAAVKAGTFRLDLLYRLQVVEITVPPLRERVEDIRPLAERSLARYAKENGRAPLGLGPEALGALERHPWPGNVRELENAMERATVLADPAQDELDAATVLRRAA